MTIYGKPASTVLSALLYLEEAIDIFRSSITITYHKKYPINYWIQISSCNLATKIHNSELMINEESLYVSQQSPDHTLDQRRTPFSD